MHPLLRGKKWPPLMLDLEVCVAAAIPHLEYGMDPKVKKELLVTNPRYCCYMYVGNVEAELYKVPMLGL